MAENEFWRRRHLEFRKKIRRLKYSQDPLKRELQQKHLDWRKNSYHSLSVGELQEIVDKIDKKDIRYVRILLASRR